ncbi:uncharacterized protein LOC113238282 [Hyposmocoma kahamanoa]|uniref:uncharacterized protein LOC113238282 n=1 Tax=Hyposmocoma kahamanoa TaxID=1477025 RepID=UPI000E6D627B|nr:uncharacterized protein LOC113238282 [Hyposmocoma kahamanoa]
MDECAKELKLNVDELREKSSGSSDKSIHCLYSCILKNKDVLNEEGKIDFDKGLEVLKGITSNEDDYKVMENIAKSCAVVNDEKVTDGIKGCERARLLLTCIASII